MASGGGITTDAEPKDGGTVELEENAEETDLEESFHDRTTVNFFAFPVLLLGLKYQIWNGCFLALPVQVYQQGVVLGFFWAMMQGVAILLQNQYQRQRLYTRIALGKAGRMDVVWGETVGVMGRLWILYPFLFILQGFQFFIGILLLKTAILEDESKWQMVACGFLLILMACGNFANLIVTLIAKAKVKSKMKKQCKNA